jgi:thioredoxin reductase
MARKIFNWVGLYPNLRSRGSSQRLGSLIILCLLFLHCTNRFTNAAATAEPTCNDNELSCQNKQLTDYLIIGAGGSGIQTALLLKKHGHTFRILEKASTAGSFWTRFPRFQELISVNKHVRNETQRYRYDWHSFLESQLGMWDVSRSYYPNGQEWHEYMNLVVEREGIDVEYGMEVARLDEDGKPCVYLVDGSAVCARYRVFVGTGLVEKDERYLRAMGGVRYSDVTLEIAEGKRVCILGNGNAGKKKLVYC